MCEAMKQAGASCQVIPVKGGLHGMPLWETFRKTDYKQKMVDWLIAATS
jgi:hypothetical protein